MVLRHWYVIKSSWPRIFDLMYWPMVQMLMWGFLQLYVAEHSNFFARAAGTFIAAVILWDILFRGQLGFSISFLEELYSRNMGNLMMSPLRPSEYVIALMVMSIIRLAIGTIPVTLLAIAFFGFNLWAMGLALALFVFNLFLTGWAVGLVVAGLLLRNGLGAENLAWGIMFLFLPLTCVYYPVSVLPDWLQVFAWMLPPTYVFEGMRALAGRPGVPRRSDGAGVRAQCAAVCRQRGCVPGAAQERAPAWHPAAGRRLIPAISSGNLSRRKTLYFPGDTGGRINDHMLTVWQQSFSMLRRNRRAGVRWRLGNLAGRRLPAVRYFRTAFIGSTR